MAGNLLVDDVVLDDGTTRMQQAGGALLHAALAASAWECCVGCVSVAGGDYPREALSTLAAKGVLLDGVRLLDTPGVRVWLLHEDGVRHMVCRLGRPSHDEVSPSPDDVPEAWREAPLMHLAPMPFERQMAFAEAFGAGARFVSLDPYRVIDESSLDEWRAVFARVDAVLASDDELRLTGARERPREVLGALASGRMRYVVHKRGAEGGALYDAREQRVWRWEPVPCEVVDPTGAGDAFAAGLVSALGEGATIERSIACGAASASVAIERDGATGLASATREELEKRAARARVWAEG